MKLLPPRYPPLPEGYSDYWMKVHVTLREGALEWDDHEQPPIAYWRILGLRCETGSYRSSVELITDDGEVDWHKCVIQARSPESFGWRRRRDFHEIDENGFWFARGCIYYSANGTNAGSVGYFF